MTLTELPLPEVTRVDNGHGSHIEPPLEQTWTDGFKLAWHAAVVAHDTGLRIRLHATDRGTYCINVGRHSLGDQPYHHAWHTLADISVGADAMRKKLEGDR